MQKLPMWRTIGAAYRFVFGRPSVFFPAAWPWFALLAATFIASLFGNAPSLPALSLSRSQQVVTALALSLGVCVVGLAFFVSVSVAIHRAIILNEVSWRAPLRFGRRQWRFLGVGILITLAMIVPFVLLEWMLFPILGAFIKLPGSEFWRSLVIVGAVGWAVSLLIWGIGSTMMIALPSVAIDEPRGAITRALQRSQGNGWRLYLGSLLCCAPSLTLKLAADLVAIAFWARWPLIGDVHARMFAEQVRNNSFLLDALDAALLVAYYSYAFRELTDATAMQGAAEQPQGAPAQ